MKNLNRFTPDLYTEAQWQWVEQKYREGYFLKDLADFLGIHKETLRRVFQRRGVKPVDREAMTPLLQLRKEFYALGHADGGKA